MKRAAVLTVLILAAGMALAAGDTRLYLNSSVTAEGGLLLGDVARIEADPATSGMLNALPVDNELYADGFIDSREVRVLLLSRGFNDHVGIFGTACRVNAPRETSGKKTDDPVPGETVVKSGDRVDVIMRKNGIIIQAPGTAIDEGRLGEGVFIRTKNSRRVRGVITGRSTVEVNL